LSGPACTAKEEVIEMLRRLPDDVSLEDIAYHVSVMAGVERGLRDLEEGRIVTHEEVKRQMDEWTS
jgi:hypothetical protein